MALKYLHCGSQLHLEPHEIWNRLGGARGFRQMGINADLMVQLAVYVRLEL